MEHLDDFICAYSKNKYKIDIAAWVNSPSLDDLSHYFNGLLALCEVDYIDFIIIDCYAPFNFNY